MLPHPLTKRHGLIARLLWLLNELVLRSRLLLWGLSHDVLELAIGLLDRVVDLLLLLLGNLGLGDVELLLLALLLWLCDVVDLWLLDLLLGHDGVVKTTIGTLNQLGVLGLGLGLHDVLRLLHVVELLLLLGRGLHSHGLLGRGSWLTASLT